MVAESSLLAVETLVSTGGADLRPGHFWDPETMRHRPCDFSQASMSPDHVVWLVELSRAKEGDEDDIVGRGISQRNAKNGENELRVWGKNAT